MNTTSGMQVDFGAISTMVFLGVFEVESGQIRGNPGQWELGPMPPDLVDLSGTIKTVGGTDICTMVLASGQLMFSCNHPGVFSLTDLLRENNETGSCALNIPLDTNGQFKLQVYADGFAPMVQRFDEFTPDVDVRLSRAPECQ